MIYYSKNPIAQVCGKIEYSPSLSHTVFRGIQWNLGTPFFLGQWFSTVGDFAFQRTSGNI